MIPPVGPKTRRFVQLSRRVERYGRLSHAVLYAMLDATRAGDHGRQFRLMMLADKLNERIEQVATLRPAVVRDAEAAWQTGEEELPPAVRFRGMVELSRLDENATRALAAAGYVE
jgi:hypothetical protein